MATRSEKLYSDSPKMERDEKGKVSVKKATEKKTEGKGGAKPDMDKMPTRHAREVQEMHKRHMDEHKDMAARHEKEMAAMPPAAADAAQSGADPDQQQSAA